MHELDPGQVRRRLAGTRLAGLVPTRLDAGMDSVAWRVGDHVVRVPRRVEGAACLATELAWLPRLAPHLSLRVSVSEVVVPPDDAFPWPIAGYPMVIGATADRAHPDGVDDPAIGAVLGRFLAGLHALEPGAEDAPIDRWRKSDLAFRADDARRRLRGVVAAGRLPEHVGRRCAASARTWAAADEVDPASVRWVHGDLHPRHVILEGGAVAGIIDWGDVHRGDPAIDVSLAWTLLSGAARESFLDVLRPDPATASRARLRALFYAACFLDHGAETGDPDHVRTGWRTLASLDLT